MKKSMLAMFLLATQEDPILAEFVEYGTNHVVRRPIPTMALVTSVTVASTPAGRKIQVVTEGASSKKASDPWVLEVFLDGEDTSGVVMAIPIGGSMDLPGYGTLPANSATLFEHDSRRRTLPITLRGRTIEILVPPDVAFDGWETVSRWRPSKLPASYAPSTTWDTLAGGRSSTEALKRAIPSLKGFLKFEHHRPDTKRGT